MIDRPNPSAPTDGRFQTFAEFWPFYVRQHLRRANRLLHCGGTLTAIAAVISTAGKWTHGPAALWYSAALVFGYGCAWVGHFFIEKNVPATFTYPVWSFIADQKMLCLTLTGRMDAEIKRHGGVPGP